MNRTRFDKKKSVLEFARAQCAITTYRGIILEL